jgi:hypothetical protein
LGTLQASDEPFDTQFSANTGNLTLTCEDNDSHIAAKILDLMIKALRLKVQHRELETARAAAASLMEEADHSADALLRGQIYLMAADQIKQQSSRRLTPTLPFSSSNRRSRRTSPPARA